MKSQFLSAFIVLTKMKEDLFIVLGVEILKV